MFKRSFFVAILLIVGSTQIIEEATSNIEVRNDIKGRFLTPEEGCGQSNVMTSNRIVGGGPAKNGAWPWLALLGFKNDTFLEFICGGSLITSRHVLSAAHCFVNNKFNFVRLGEYNTTTESDGKHVDVKIDRFDIHMYTKLLKIDDVSLVHLDHDVDFSDRIRPICLPTGDDLKKLDLVGLSPFVAGWGNLEENSKKNAHILHEIQIPIISNEHCQEKYHKARGHKQYDEMRFNKKFVLCAGFTEGGRDACEGDSGGPMMLPLKNKDGRFAFYQIGIVSYGIGCGRTNIPGVYANVRNYIDWITKKMQ